MRLKFYVSSLIFISLIFFSIAALGTPADILFTVIDGTESYVNIKIKGTFNNWVPEPMYDDGTHGDEVAGDHTWSVMIYSVLEGDHEWGAIEDDGSEWGIWLIEGPNPQFTVHGDGSVTGQTSYEIPAPGVPVDITFQVDMTNEDVSENGVFVAGSFQNWDPTATPMSDDDEDEVYTVTVELESGTTHQYKFINGDAWENVPGECGVDDGFGGYNREVLIPEEDAALDAVYFGTCDTSTDIGWVGITEVPEIFRLHQNYPNPFNPTTQITFSLPQSSRISLNIYALNGQLIDSLVEDELDAGYHQIIWNGTNARGETVSSGIYLYSLETEQDTAVKQMILLK